MTDAPSGFEVQAQWILDPMMQAPNANQILIQSTGSSTPNAGVDGAYVSIGHLNPPMPPNPGDAASTIEYLRANVFPVAPIARFYVSKQVLVEFRDQLTRFIEGDSAQS